VATGRIYPEVIGIATQASINLQRVTGQSADEVAKDFARMGDDVAKWAMEHNKHMHFVSAAQFKYIKELSDAGKSSEAAAETLKLLNAQVQTQTIDIGNLEAGWIKFTQALSAAKDVMMGWGKKNIHGETLDNLLSQLKQAQVAAELANSGSPTLAGMLGRKQNAERIASLSAEIAKQRELMRFEDQAANQRAASDQIAEKAIKKIMEKNPPVKPESHDPLENRIQSFRQAELSSQAATNEALRTGNLKAYETARADAIKAKEAALAEAIKQEEEFARIVGSAHVKDNLRRGNHDMPFETARANAITDYFRDVGDQTKRAEGLVTGSFSRMEDAIVNFAKTGKLSFGDLFGFMAEEFIRNQIKMAEKSLLTDSAGNFLGMGNLLSSAGGFLGIPGFANGLDYVPHDNYPAMLHEGERVLTRQDAANGSARGGGISIDGSITIGSVGAGTSRAEVFAAVQQASAQTKASIMRTLKQHGVTA
jgi:phage-related minor tail protein